MLTTLPFASTPPAVARGDTAAPSRACGKRQALSGVAFHGEKRASVFHWGTRDGRPTFYAFSQLIVTMFNTFKHWPLPPQLQQAS